MKKLIIILAIISLNQTMIKSQLSKDKYYHAGAGVIGTGLIFTPFYLASNDENLSFRASCIFMPMVAVSKEVYDVSNGGEFSLSDAGITIAFNIASSYVTKKIITGIKKKRQKTIYVEFLSENELIKKE